MNALSAVSALIVIVPQVTRVSLSIRLFCPIFQLENILLDDNFNVKVSDFGFASVISHDEELTGKE